MCGEKIRKLRVNMNMTQEELAEKIGTSRQTVSKWENGSCFPDTDRLRMLCECFGCSADYLLDQAGTDKLSEHPMGKDDRKTKRIRIAVILMAAELLALAVMAMTSQFVTSRKTIVRQMEVQNEYSDYTSTETLQDQIEVTEFLPFLQTYHLKVIFICICADLGVNIIFLWKQSGLGDKKRRTRMI